MTERSTRPAGLIRAVSAPLALMLVASAGLALGGGLLLTPATALAYGEGVDDQPSLEERAVHFFTDRLRVDPDATDNAFVDYEAVRPLIFNADLHEAARFYADDMAANGCFPADHSSCDGTSFGARVNSFYSGGAIGENIALGSPHPEAVVFEGWLYSDGHRENMLSNTWNELGTGFARNSGGQPYWVQDFGSRGGIEEPITTSGTHWPLRPSAGDGTTFYLAVFDPDGQPAGAELALDGECSAMEVDRGRAGMITWRTTRPAGTSGCRPYVMVLTRGDGEEVRYPSTGAFLLPVGDTECAVWTEETPGSTCTPNEDGGGFGANGGCNAGGADGPEAEGPDGNVEDNVEYGSCAVAAPAGTEGVGSRAGLWASGLLGLLLLRRRRR